MFIYRMDNMIHAFNKVTNRNQYKVPRKIKRRAELASKRIIKQDRPEKKLDESNLKRYHYGLLTIIIFLLTYYLSSFLPLSSLSAPSLPIKTLHELNLLASNLSDLLAKESSSTAK